MSEIQDRGASQAITSGAAMPLRAASEAVWSELDELRCKLRMVISHASGGALSKPGDIDRSTNDICVEISRHKNEVWKHAQEVARRDALAAAAREGGDVEQAPGEAPQSGGDSRNAQPESSQ